MDPLPVTLQLLLNNFLNIGLFLRSGNAMEYVERKTWTSTNGRREADKSLQEASFQNHN